jgi:hypothetical protein
VPELDVKMADGKHTLHKTLVLAGCGARNGTFAPWAIGSVRGVNEECNMAGV